MRRKIYKKIVAVLSIVAFAFLLASYFVGLQSNRSIKLEESSQNPATASQEASNLGVTSTSSQNKNVSNQSETDLVEKNQPLITASLKVQDQTYSTQIKEGSSAHELMIELQKQGLTFSGVEYSGIGFYVSEINGLKEDKKARSYWTLYINGKESNLGISALILKNNDTIEWKYETRN
jgi:CHASE3 domain sensor protein